MPRSASAPMDSVEVCWQSVASGQWTPARPPERFDYSAPVSTRYSGANAATFRDAHQRECTSVSDAPLQCYHDAVRYAWAPRNASVWRTASWSQLTPRPGRQPSSHPHGFLESFCSTLERLGIDTVSMVGDSVIFQMVQSMWKLLLDARVPLFPTPREVTIRCCHGPIKFAINNRSDQLTPFSASSPQYGVDDDAVIQHIAKLARRRNV